MSLDGDWLRELRHAARRLRIAPGFATVAIVTLAIGVGVNSAMFGLIDALLFRPPAHVSEPERVVRVRFSADGNDEPWWRQNYPAYLDLAATRVFESVAGYSGNRVSIGLGPDAVEGAAMFVTPSFFRVLGVRPHAGQLIGALGVDTLADNRVVLSHSFWMRRFGGDPQVIGRSLIVGTSSYTVAGIAPEGFTVLQESPVDLWLPLNDLAGGYLFDRWRTSRGAIWLDVVARVPVAGNAAALEQRASDLLRMAAPERGRGAPAGIVTSSVVSGRDGSEQSREVRVSLWLAGVTAFVLLIACANIANLMLARNVARAREYAVRLSLGASSWQLRRQLAADVIAIAIPGLAAALLVEYAVRGAIPAFLAAEVPIPRAFLDSRTLGLMAISGFVAIALVSIVSFTQVRPTAMAQSLTTRTTDERKGSGWTRGSLLALQSGLCVALLFSAGLFARSLQRVLALDLGVELDRTIQTSFNFARGSRSPEEVKLLYERAIERVRAHAGVERAALSGRSPFQSGNGSSPYTAEQSQRELWEGKGEVAYSSAVGAGFFTTTGATSLEGRDFTEDDRAGAPRVAIINANLAKRLWPQGTALGNCLFVPEAKGCHRVVGVLGGVWKLRALDRDKMTIYTPLAQTEDAGAMPGAILVRTRGPVGPMLGEVREIMQSIEAQLPAVSVSRALDLVDREFRPWRLGATLFAGFSAIALVIAAVGLYGVVSFTTAQRTREIGVRMALGAPVHDIMRVVAGSGLGAVIAGLIMGSAASLAAARWMGDVLYQTSPRDPAVLAQTAGILMLVAAVAVVVPVMRALRMAPSAVLRSE